MRNRFALLSTVLTAALVLLASPSESPGAKKDKSYLHPKFKSFDVRSIGLLPWMQRQQNPDAERILRPELAQGLAPTGYSFTDDTHLRTLARGVGAESLLVDATVQYAKDATIRPETLVEIGERVSVDAILAPFLDRWESETIAVEVRGYSRTDIAARLSLFSTKTGELLWNASIEASGQGPYNDPGAGNLSRTAPTAQGKPTTSLDPPSFEQVADQWSHRVTEVFPPRPKEKPKAEEDPSASVEKTGL